MASQQIHFEGEMCEECGVNPKMFSGYTVAGRARYKPHCRQCHRGKYEKPWLQSRGSECEQCGHTPMFKRGLDVHHRDGDNTNNDVDNLMTLCANCHRDMEGLIYELEGDWEKAETIFAKLMQAILGR